MNFSGLIGQSLLVDRLKSIISGERVAHAYLFIGQKGAGKKTLADLFARSLLCTSKGDKPCGVCKSCRQISSGNHPDVMYIRSDKTVIGVNLIREMLNRAERYYEEEKNGSYHEYDEELEVFIPVFNGEIPLKIHAHRLDDIMTAIRIAEEFGLDYTLDHCTEGYMAADYIKEKNIPVMLGPLFSFATKVETKDACAEAPAIFNDKGILISFISDHPFMNCKFLPLYAGLLSRYGLDMIDGLKALTINPAKALRIDNRVGSIEEGKDADLAVFNGEPLETMTKVTLTIINGDIVYKDFD